LSRAVASVDRRYANVTEFDDQHHCVVDVCEHLFQHTLHIGGPRLPGYLWNRSVRQNLCVSRNASRFCADSRRVWASASYDGRGRREPFTGWMCQRPRSLRVGIAAIAKQRCAQRV